MVAATHEGRMFVLDRQLAECGEARRELPAGQEVQVRIVAGYPPTKEVDSIQAFFCYPWRLIRDEWKRMPNFWEVTLTFEPPID